MGNQQSYDVVVVGAGIVGLAHAYHAHERGLSVAVVDHAAKALDERAQLRHGVGGGAADPHPRRTRGGFPCNPAPEGASVRHRCG